MTDTWTSVTIRQEITEEVREVVRGVVDGWYSEGRIDWDDVWDRVDGSLLEDGSRIHLGESTNTPAFRALQVMIRKERAE